MAAQWIYGIHAVNSVLEYYPENIIEFWLLRTREDKRLLTLKGLAESCGLVTSTVTQRAFREQFGDVVHQGVAIRVKTLPSYQLADLAGLIERVDTPLFLLLDELQDPHNLGACLRSAAGFGVTAVILPTTRSVSVTATARKVACGGDVMVPIVSVTNLAQAMRQLKSMGVWLVGTTDQSSTRLTDIDLCGPIGIVMGQEGKGIRHQTAKLCDFLGSIEMSEQMPSLNVAVATGVTLYEVQRQRNR